jgi:serine/threonine protein kinase
LPAGSQSHFAWLSEVTNQALVDSHPNLLALVGIRVFEGRLVLLYPFVKGETLQTEINSPCPERLWSYRRQTPGADGPSFVNIDEACRIMHAALRALIACHACGVLHLDFTPSNILIASENRHVFVSDFGTSRLAAAVDNAGAQDVDGTKFFLAPEILRRERARKRSDCFAWGMCFLTAVLGEPVRWSDPASGPCRDEVRRGVQCLPPELASVIVAALDPNPLARPKLAAAERCMRQFTGTSQASTSRTVVPREASLLEDIGDLVQRLESLKR